MLKRYCLLYKTRNFVRSGGLHGVKFNVAKDLGYFFLVFSFHAKLIIFKLKILIHTQMSFQYSVSKVYCQLHIWQKFKISYTFWFIVILWWLFREAKIKSTKYALQWDAYRPLVARISQHALRGVCYRGGLGVSAPGGYLLNVGVCSRGCLLLEGMSAPWGISAPGGVSALGRRIPACTEADTRPMNRITDRQV